MLGLEFKFGVKEFHPSTNRQSRSDMADACQGLGFSGLVWGLG